MAGARARRRFLAASPIFLGLFTAGSLSLFSSQIAGEKKTPKVHERWTEAEEKAFFGALKVRAALFNAPPRFLA